MEYDFSERVSLYGASKRRWRCPKCLRAFRSNSECEEHGRYDLPYMPEPIDIKKADAWNKRNIVEIKLTDLFSNRYSRKKIWTLQEIHEKTSLDVSYLEEAFGLKYFDYNWRVKIK